MALWHSTGDSRPALRRQDSSARTGKRTSERTRTWARIGLGLVGSLIFASLLLAPAAVALPSFSNIDGADPYKTAVKLSQARFTPGGTATSGLEAVVLASGADAASAIISNPLAAAYHGPVLLTHPRSLDTMVRDEMTRLRPGTVFLVGLSPNVAVQVRQAFPTLAESDIVQLSGKDAIETSRLVALQLRQKLGARSTVAIAPKADPIFSLCVSPLASAEGWPILLCSEDGSAGSPIDAAVAATISEVGATNAVAVGTDAPVGGVTVKRISPADVYEVSADIAAYAKETGLSFAHVALTSDTEYSDALAAPAYLAVDRGILLLTSSTTVSSPISATLTAHAFEIEQLDLLALDSGPAWQAWLLFPYSQTPPSSPRLSSGSRGIAVQWLEHKLASLTYKPGPIDGIFDSKTRQAVIAFQKWEGLSRTGVVDATTWERLLQAKRPVSKNGAAETGTWIEVDKTRQVLMLIHNGLVIRTLAVSTGNPSVGIATPSGTFSITRMGKGYEGPRYYPMYLRTRGVLAIHGYPSVPAYPASHGCVRVPMTDAPDLWSYGKVGMKVYVY